MIQFFRWKIIHLHFDCTYASTTILLTPFRWTKSWARLAVSLSPSNLPTPTWAPKSQRLTGREIRQDVDLFILDCWSLQSPAASKQVVIGGIFWPPKTYHPNTEVREVFGRLGNMILILLWRFSICFKFIMPLQGSQKLGIHSGENDQGPREVLGHLSFFYNHLKGTDFQVIHSFSHVSGRLHLWLSSNRSQRLCSRRSFGDTYEKD